MRSALQLLLWRRLPRPRLVQGRGKGILKNGMMSEGSLLDIADWTIRKEVFVIRRKRTLLFLFILILMQSMRAIFMEVFKVHKLLFWGRIVFRYSYWFDRSKEDSSYLWDQWWMWWSLDILFFDNKLLNVEVIQYDISLYILHRFWWFLVYFNSNEWLPQYFFRKPGIYDRLILYGN